MFQKLTGLVGPMGAEIHSLAKGGIKSTQQVPSIKKRKKRLKILD
jgi:hypothetical protein